ncbi:MAG: hypothetical protein MZV63_15550 [Marinilabiliales bacterium]|nr:hypothetical protein [Marinilabiliales bacterium]
MEIMPQTTLSIDDWLKSRPKTLGIDDYISTRPRVHSAEELFADTSFKKQKQEQEDKKTLGRVVGSMLEQMGYEFLESASFGLVNKPETMRPVNQAAEIAGEIGSLGGLLIGPGKLIKGPTKAASAFLRPGTDQGTG